MTVAHILAEKGSDTVTLPSSKTLGEAASLMSRHRIGAVVIVDGDGAVEGILSERDIVRAVADKGGEGLSEPISARMSKKVVTCSTGAALTELMEMMTEGKFRHVPVIERGRLAGMVSIGDIVKHRLAEMEAEHQAMRSYIATA